MEWLPKLLDYGGLGILCLLEAVAIRFLWGRLEKAQEALSDLERKRGDENKERLSQVLQAMGGKRSQTSYSMQTSTNRTRE